MTINIAKTLLDAALERASSCTGAFHFGVPHADEEIGSGVLINHDGRNYALTCEHVLTSFLRAPYGELVIGDGVNLPGIQRSAIKVVGSNKEDDLALAEIVVPLPSRISPRKLSEFEAVDFRSISANRRGFAVIGFPARSVVAKGNSRSLRPLAYLTVDSSTMSQEESFLYLAYREGPDAPVELPSPYGLSGSSVLAFDLLDSQTEDVFGFGKIVAIQIERGPNDDYIKCTGLRRLFGWLNSPVPTLA